MTGWDIFIAVTLSVQFVFNIMLMASLGYINKMRREQYQVMFEMATKTDANFAIVANNFKKLDQAVVVAAGLEGSILDGTLTDPVSPPKDGMLN